MEWAGWLGWLRDIVHRRSARRSRKMKARLAVAEASKVELEEECEGLTRRANDLETEKDALRAEADLLGFQLERTNMQIELLRMQVEHSGAMIGVQRDWIESFRAHPNEGRIP